MFNLQLFFFNTDYKYESEDLNLQSRRKLEILHRPVFFVGLELKS